MTWGQTENWVNYVKPEVIHDYVEMNNDIWFSTNAGVVKIDKTTSQKTYFDRASANIPSNFVEGIAKDGNGNIWIGTYNQAIAKFDGTNWTNYSFATTLNVTGTIKTYCIEVDNQDNIWVGTSEGLLRFDGTNWQKYDAQNVGDIMFDDVWALALDNQGNLFIYRYNKRFQI